jgi:uncharacterized protein with NRDE domain
MCTLILLHRCVEGAPLVVAANRDEYLDRPSAPPALRPGAGLAVVAPGDLRAGGTWLGVNAAGLFAGLTNRPTATPDPSRRSRGLLVLDALQDADAASAAKRLESLPHGAYNPFNLVVADADAAFAVTYDEAPRSERLAPGAHVIGNADPDAASVPKIARLLGRAEEARRLPAADVLDALADLCRGHDGRGTPLDDACIHTERYGTRSSTLLQLAGAPRESALRFADGPPCRTAYDDFTPLLHALGHEAEPRAGEHLARTAP